MGWICFFLGLIVGAPLAFLVYGLVSAGRDYNEYVELSNYEEMEK